MSLRLNNQRELVCSGAFPYSHGSEYTYFLFLDGLSEADARTIFSDPTQSSIMQYEGTSIVGYTVLNSVEQLPYGVKVQISKPREVVVT